MDRAGRVVIPFRFLYAGSFTGGRAAAAVRDPNAPQGRREGLIDRRGQWIVPAGQYEELGVGRQGRWPFAVRTRQAGPEPRGIFDEDDSATAKRRDEGQRWGFLDANGTVVIEPKYWKVGVYNEGLCFADDGNTPAFINRQGRTVFRLPSSANKRRSLLLRTGVSQFRKGLARARRDGKWGFIDKTGEFVIPPRFEWVESFSSSNGVAAAVLNGQIILIDRQGKTIVNTGTKHEVF